jgi:hypothetical protein
MRTATVTLTPGKAEIVYDNGTTKTLNMPDDGRVWWKVWGDVPEDYNYIEDADGWKYFLAEPIETGGETIDLSDCFE